MRSGAAGTVPWPRPSLHSGRELGLHVVAEGVETREQSAFLLRRGCNVQQGYLFSRPVPAAAFEQLLRVGFVEVLGPVST